MQDHDQAAIFEELRRKIALEYRKPEIKVRGFCQYCFKTLPSDHAFCDAGCRDDWQKEQDAEKRKEKRK